MDDIEKIETYFDSPERDATEKVLADSQSLKQNQYIVQLLEAFPDLAVILNKHRQLVLCNSSALSLFNVNDIFEFKGKRFGEAFDCIHKDAMASGCGTSKFCRECGAAKAILRSRQNFETAEEECRIVANRNGKEISFDFSVKTKPFEYNGSTFTIFAVRDISGEKRRDSLERIFFHDVLNTATAINGLTELLYSHNTEEDNLEIKKVLKESIEQLLNEIVSQREIRHAEDGNLSVNISEVSASGIATIVFELYKKHEIAKSKNFILDFPDEDIIINTDPTLLIRAIGNLIKNALEATETGGNVVLSFHYNEDYVQFNVHNEAILTQKVSVQIFQRSFSTKAAKGRGLGLYSVKLIIENYLKGKVFFVSDAVHKTVFSIKLPLH